MQYSADTEEGVPSEPSTDGTIPRLSDPDDGSEDPSDSEIEPGVENRIQDVENCRMHHIEDASTSLYIAANQTLLGEIGQQHNETLSSIGNLTQRSGIVMAFNSVFLLELFRLDPNEELIWWVSAISILVGMMLGLATVVTGRMAPLGADIDIVKSTYENRMYEELTPIIFNERRIALNKPNLRRKVELHPFLITLRQSD